MHIFCFLFLHIHRRGEKFFINATEVVKTCVKDGDKWKELCVLRKEDLICMGAIFALCKGMREQIYFRLSVPRMYLVIFGVIVYH